jgi:hypothetical protein
MRNFHIIHKTKNVIPAKAGIYNRINKAQSTIEFTFAMIAIMFLIYGMVMVFRWAGMDLAQRRFSQDNSMTTTNLVGGDPASQLNADVDGILPIAAVYHGSITNGNTAQ